eukprot:1003434-Amphidinium_carterae.1
MASNAADRAPWQLCGPPELQGPGLCYVGSAIIKSSPSHYNSIHIQLDKCYEFKRHSCMGLLGKSCKYLDEFSSSAC